MGKKSMGKVKHYRHSFYSGGQKAKRILSVAVVLLVLFLLGWFAGPAVIDFGTSTWYKIKNGGQSGQDLSQSLPENPDGQLSDSQFGGEPESESDAEPTPEPPAQKNPGEGGWAFLKPEQIQDAAQAAQTAQQLADQGVRYAVLPIKDEKGVIAYPSQLEAAKSAVTAKPYDLAAAAAALKQQDIVPVGAVCAFQDPAAANANRDMAVLYQNKEYLWLDRALDDGGKPWLDPTAPSAAAYVRDVIAEAKQLGCEEIWLTGLRFPPTSGRDKAVFRDTAGKGMAQVLAEALALMEEQAPCWVAYPVKQAAQGAENPLLGAEPAALGMGRLVLLADADDTPETVDAAVQAAKAGGVETVGVLGADGFALR